MRSKSQVLKFSNELRRKHIMPQFNSPQRLNQTKPIVSKYRRLLHVNTGYEIMYKNHMNPFTNGLATFLQLKVPIRFPSLEKPDLTAQHRTC